jgi:hypothetical protein
MKCANEIYKKQTAPEWQDNVAIFGSAKKVCRVFGRLKHFYPSLIFVCETGNVV